MTASTHPTTILTDATVNFARCEVIEGELKAANPDPSFHRALDHAMTDLYNRRAFELRGNQLRTQSSRSAFDWYDTTIDTCTCETQRGVCRHRGKLAILLAYQTLIAAATACQPLTPAQPTPTLRRARRGGVAIARVEITVRHSVPMTDAEYARVCAQADELC